MPRLFLLLVLKPQKAMLMGRKAADGIRRGILCHHQMMIVLLLAVFLSTAKTFRPSKFRLSYSHVLLHAAVSTPPFQVSLEERTMECLDIGVILDELRSLAVTTTGKSMMANHIFDSEEECRSAYSKVEQLIPHCSMLPIRSELDALSAIERIEGVGTLEKEDLALFSLIVEEIQEIKQYLEDNVEALPLFDDISKRLELPYALIDVFEGAFDDQGNLDGAKFPELGRLRTQESGLKSRIISTIKQIANDPAMRDKVADTGFDEIDGRFCLMLKSTYKKGVGIVHGSS